MADIIRHAGHGFAERSHRWINGQHLKVLDAIPPDLERIRSSLLSPTAWAVI
jgi:hypothetical protein